MGRRPNQPWLTVQIVVARHGQAVLPCDHLPRSTIDLEDVLHEDFPLEERAVRLQREVGEAQPVEVVGLQELVEVRRAQPVRRVARARRVCVFRVFCASSTLLRQKRRF